jgi:nitrite reductase/ring-hydroxylating ferredoxin subunit
MEDFVPVTQSAELPPGKMACVLVEGERVLLANVEGTFYALEDVCGHQRVQLSKGLLEGHVVECPLHFARFDVRTGTLIDGPSSDEVRTYDVRVQDGTVYVKCDPND